MVLNDYIRFSLVFLCLIIFASCKKQSDGEKNTHEESKYSERQYNDNKTNLKSEQEVPEHRNIELNSYKNSRFGYAISFPTNNNDYNNGDGREFSSPDGFNIWVYGSNKSNSSDQSLDEIYYRELNSHKDVTYKVKKNNWFVVSGYDGEIIFYIKKYVGLGSTNTLLLNYPSNLRDKYYDIVTLISKSFKPGQIDTAN